MAKGYRWVRVQIAQLLHERVTKAKGQTSWDDTIVQALTAMLDAKADRDTADARKEVP